MTNPTNLIKQAQKLDRRIALNSLLEKITKHPPSSSERRRILDTVIAKALSGELTPTEAQKLIKAI